uniref:Uncharacterized protein n=1 Tax=Candidatus Kentrum sp. UNK TaxID=2126344 RepID=A0A451B000_9GAMM|nr:MAG: hypothetical protein BECKUNK1418G_GA0071005_10734 [Candidatus Kentron sp. UNK]VFK71605.1 MAG: hypothetical protein BECKUNK1418H_GA0071006_10744 [Candidatus Kentron sp. UNK]
MFRMHKISRAAKNDIFSESFDRFMEDFLGNGLYEKAISYKFRKNKNMLALRARLQTGCSLRRRQFFGDFCFSDT